MEIKTWGQALDYTFKTRHTWRHGNGRKTAAINCDHFTRHRGLSFPIRSINQAEITQLSILLEEEGKSDATINRVVSAVSTVLNHCADEELLPRPPRFKRRKEHEGRVLYYTQDEVDRMVHLSTDVFGRTDLAEIITFAAYTGMRQGEILKLRKKDVDLASNRIWVGGMPEVKTKAGNCRAIPIHSRIMQILHSRYSQVTDSVRLFGEEWRDKDQLLRAFRKVNHMVPKDESYCFHTLRHSFATWSAEAGVPIRTLMALMGHKRIETTLRYAKATDSALVEAIERI